MKKMRAVLVDDDQISANVFKNILEEHKNVQIMNQFSNAEQLLLWLQTNEKREIDVAILDIRLPGMSGVELAQKIRNILPEVVIIFETAFEDYAIDAYKLRAAGYILKPYDAKEIAYVLESAALLVKRTWPNIYVRTFGHFDLFIDGKAMFFKSAKAKELLAMLVDRQGGTVTTEQMIAYLWEDRPYDENTQNLASKVTKSLKTELKGQGIERILNVGRGYRSLNTDLFSCDLYELLDGDRRAFRQFYGEYMSDYYWGESRIQALNRLYNEKSDKKI